MSNHKESCGCDQSLALWAALDELLTEITEKRTSWAPHELDPTPTMSKCAVELMAWNPHLTNKSRWKRKEERRCKEEREKRQLRTQVETILEAVQALKISPRDEPEFKLKLHPRR